MILYKKGDFMDGILIINKPKNMTSRDVVNIVSKKLNTRKVGHTGTLDPLAIGVLVIAVNKALKLVDDITSLNKEYIAEVTLGIKTDTLDITGNILEEKEEYINKEELIDALNSFKGKYNMTVPIYSAVKVNGKKLYEYAREGKKIELPVKEVYISDIELLDINNNKFTFKCNVSKGTYIRSLINDICNKLGVIGTMSNLTRTKQGKFNIEDSINIDDITEDNIVPMEEIIDIPKIEVDEYLYNRIINGNKLENRYNSEKISFTYQNKLIAIYITDPGDLKKVKPKHVLKN